MTTPIRRNFLSAMRPGLFRTGLFRPGAVNTSFLIGLIATVVLVFAVGVILVRKFVTKSAEDHFALGQAAEVVAKGTEEKAKELRQRANEARSKDAAAFKAADDAAKAAEAAMNAEYEKARSAYSKAVNKNKANVEYIKKWLEVLGKMTPTPRDRFKDVYKNEYLIARRSLVDAAQQDVAVQKQWLDTILEEVRLSPQQTLPSTWENIVGQAEAAMRNFPEGDKGRDVLRRYRGLARVNLLALATTVREDAAKAAKEDLEAALAADPDDAVSAAFLGDWHRVMAARARADRRNEEADALTKAGRDGLAKFVAERKGVAWPMLTLTQLEIMEAARTTPRGSSMEAFVAEQRVRVNALVDRVLAEPADLLDRQIGAQIAAMTVAYFGAEGRDKALAVLDHVLSARPTDVYTLFKRGEIELAVNRYDAAVATLRQLAEMNDLPLSFDGMLLFGLREEAVARQAEATLALWQREKEEAKRAELMTQAKGFRNQLAASVGESAGRVLLLDGKIAFYQGDLAGARQLLAQYNDQTVPPRSDPAGLRLLAEVLMRQDNLGGAQQQLEAALALNENDLDSIRGMALVYTRLQNAEKALEFWKRFLQIDPSNQQVKEEAARLEDILREDGATDPATRALSRASKLINGVPPDPKGAKEVLVKGLAEVKKVDFGPAYGFASAFLAIQERELAREVLLRGQRENPQEARFASLLSMLDRDPVEVELEAISTLKMPEQNRLMLRFQLLTRAGRTAEAEAELAKAKALAPEDSLVIAGAFDYALVKNDMAEAERCAALATTKNFDRVGGRIYRARLAQLKAAAAFNKGDGAEADRQLKDALALSTAAVEMDPLNPITHRLMGLILQQLGRAEAAVTAFEKALNLRPDDVASIKSLILALLAAERGPKALELCRANKQYAANDEEFGDIWVTLEAKYGGPEGVSFAIDRRSKRFERNPKDAVNARELAALLMNRQRLDEARKVIDALKAQAGKTDLALVEMDAVYYAAKGDGKAAVKVYEDFIAGLSEELRRNPEPWLAYGRFRLQRLNDYAGARTVLESARPFQAADTMEIDRELGDTAFSVGDWATAVDALQRALDSVKADDGNRIRFRIIEATLKMANWEKAEQLCAAAEKLNISNERQKQTLLLLRAEAAVGAGRTADAASFLDRAVAADATSALGYYKRGELRIRDQSQLNDGIADLERAVKLDPATKQFRRLLAEVLYAVGRTQQAVEVLQEGIAFDPLDPILRDTLVKVHLRADRTDLAIKVIEDASKISLDPRWQIMMAELYWGQGDLNRASQYYGQAWEKTKFPALARSYCDVLLTVPPAVAGRPAPRADLPKAKDVLAHPDARTDETVYLLTTRARVAWMEKRPQDAVADLRKAFGKVNADSQTEVASFFQDLLSISPKPTEALQILNEFKPAAGFPDAVQLQVVRLKLIEPTMKDEGVRELDALVQKAKAEPWLAQGLKTVGTILYGQAQYDASEAVYLKAIEVKPDDAETKNNLAYLLSKFKERHQEALPLAEAAAAAMPRNASVLDTLGYVLLRLKRFDEAESVFIRALDVATGPTEKTPVLLHLTQLAFDRGQRSKAEERLDQLMREIERAPAARRLYAPEIDELRKNLNRAN
jgi:tetratricopeptide (TPR) repeat protein